MRLAPHGAHLTAPLGLLVGLALLAAPATALADGQLDPSFGVGGRVILSFEKSSGLDAASSVLPTPDGKLITTGLGGGAGSWVTQLLPSGALDSGFAADGQIDIPAIGGYAFVGPAVRKPDGTILAVGGSQTGLNFDTLMEQFTAQGVLDPSFGNDPPNPTGDGIVDHDFGGNDLLDAVALDPQQRPIGAGRIGPSKGIDVHVLRFNPDGSVDSGFGGPNGVTTNLGTGDDEGEAITTQGNRILVLAETDAKSYVLAYTPTGALDTSFGGGDGEADLSFPDGSSPRALLVQPDGRIVAAGSDDTAGYVERLLPDGAPDPSFGAGGTATIPAPAGMDSISISAMVETEAGRIDAVGTVIRLSPVTEQVAIVRLQSNGQPDPGWGTSGVDVVPVPPSTQESAYAIAALPGRKLAIGGASYDASAFDDNRLVLRVLGDTTAPDTAITGAQLAKSTATFSFHVAGDPADADSTFQCELIAPAKRKPKHHRRHRHHRHRHHGRRLAASAPAFSPCSSPATYTGLKTPGNYAFRVFATDPAGNADATPAETSVKVAKPRHHRRRHKHHRHHHG